MYKLRNIRSRWQNYSPDNGGNVCRECLAKKENANNAAGIWTRNVCMIIKTATIAGRKQVHGSNRQAVNDDPPKTCSRKCPLQRIQAKLIWSDISRDSDNGSPINFERLLVFSSMLKILFKLFENLSHIRFMDRRCCCTILPFSSFDRWHLIPPIHDSFATDHHYISTMFAYGLNVFEFYQTWISFAHTCNCIFPPYIKVNI